MRLPSFIQPCPVLLTAMLLCLVSKQARADDLVFEKSIRPIFVSKCGKCHGSKVQKAELSLVTQAGVLRGGESGQIVKARDSEDSLLLEMITDGTMPPEKEPRLKASEISLIRRWIESGARFAKPANSKTERRVTHADIVPLMLRRC